MIYEERIFSFGGLDKDMNHVKINNLLFFENENNGRNLFKFRYHQCTPTGFYDLAIF